MSNAKDTLNRVLDVLGLGKAEATIEVEMAQKKTMDGEVVLDSENFAIGEPVFIVTEEGNIPVPMGEYILEDGMKIETDEKGVIVEVSTEKEEEVTEEVIEEVEAKDMIEKEETGMMGKDSMPKKVVKSKTEMEESYFSKIDARLSAIELSNESLKAENIKLSAENDELKKQLAETPAPHASFSPEAETKTELKFKIGAKREVSIKDRVFDSLF
jgi:regulator of replication initiation timing